MALLGETVPNALETKGRGVTARLCPGDGAEARRSSTIVLSDGNSDFGKQVSYFQ